MIMGAFNILSATSLQIAQISPMPSLIEPILQTPSELSESKKVLSKLSGEIEINNISFRYNENMPYIIKIYH